MDRNTTVATLHSLGWKNPEQAVAAVDDSSTALLRSDAGSSVALLRRGDKYDALVLGAGTDCPVLSLRAVLETAVLPMSDKYAADVGIAIPERDAVRKRIREASVALDVIAKGRHFSVTSPDLPVLAELRKHIDAGATSVDHLPDEFLGDLAILNKLQASVVAWSREIDRVVQMSRNVPDAVLSVEEETVFWSSLDAALSNAQQKLATPAVRFTLDVLARQRRATGFLADASNSLDTARRKAAGVLALIQGLPIVALRTAEDLGTLRKGVELLLEHVAAKLRVSSFSVDRVLSLVDAMGFDVCRSTGRILSIEGGLLQISFVRFVQLFELCCDLFEAWSHGFDHCRKVARETARKKGEMMPRRRRSPLSNLHTHLSHVYGLRADHQALRAVLSALASESPSYRGKVDALDTAFEWLEKASSSFEHFEVTPVESATWAQISTEYQSKLAKTELAIAGAYQEVVQSGTNILELSEALCPFRCVLDKPFMTVAASEAAGIVLDLGRKYLLLLQSREARLSTGLFSNCPIDVPYICSTLAGYGILLNHTAQLLNCAENAVGRTQLEASPDLRDFVTDVGCLRERADPLAHLRTWLTSVDVNSHERSVLQVTSLGHDGRLQLGMTLTSDTALFHVAVKLFRDDQRLGSVLEPQHYEFSRSSKALFPTYSNVKEALECLNSSFDMLRMLSADEYDRVVESLAEERANVVSIVEDTSDARWADAHRKLFSLSANLCKKSTEWACRVSSLLECDRALQCALDGLRSTHPKLLEGRMCEETKVTLSVSVSHFADGLISMTARLSAPDACRRLKSKWLRKLNSSLLEFIDRLFIEWSNAIASGTMSSLTAVLDARPQVEGPMELFCKPELEEIEQCLYNNLGDLLDSFAGLVDSAFRRTFEISADGVSVPPSAAVIHFLESQTQSACLSEFVPATAKISQTVHSLRCEANAWAPFVGFLNPSFFEHQENSTENLHSFFDDLEYLVASYEAIASLQNYHATDAALQKSTRLLDTTPLSKRILSNCIATMTTYCEASSKAAAVQSQKLYRNISDAKKDIFESSELDSFKLLSKLQSIKETVLPRCRAEVAALQALEDKFEDTRDRIMENSFLQVQSSDSWILAQELQPHMINLQNLCEQRSESVLVNATELKRKYERRRQEYQGALASTFSEFQRVRRPEQSGTDFVDSTSALRALKKKVTMLDEEGLALELVGRALGLAHSSNRQGSTQILEELEKVVDGISKLCSVDEKVLLLSRQTIGEADPGVIRDALVECSSEIETISEVSGAKREASVLSSKLRSISSANMYLAKLSAISLSTPRERDLMRRIFGENYPSGGLKAVTLEAFWNADLSQHDRYLQDVFENAAGEASVCEYLASVEKSWSGRKCSFSDHAGASILRGIPDLLDELDEHMQGLETMKASQHARLFESERISWEQRLAKCREDLELLADVQSRWAHLRTLFGSGRNSGISGLRAELQEEFLAFSNVHARFIAFGDRVRNSSGIVEALEGPSGLNEMVVELAGIVRCLSSFLEKQRSRFPRFFFLSDDAMLHVISASPSGIEGLTLHVSKLFPGVSVLLLDENGSTPQISGISSKDGEVLQFSDPVALLGKPSSISWLFEVQDRITKVLKSSFTASCQLGTALLRRGGSVDMRAFMASYIELPAQIALLGLRIAFTNAVEGCLCLDDEGRGSLHGLMSSVSEALVGLCGLAFVLKEAHETQHRLSTVRAQLIKELIYQRDLLRVLEQQRVSSALSHFWDHELRFYLSASSSGASDDVGVEVRCGNGTFVYGWEYLGMGESLVRTSLTSRCFLTLCEALRRGYGGSPFGPAGTGKTETVKALGRAMGRFVAVFNCDESFDSVAVGRILAGACRIGSWVCFDEFNRLSSAILSSTSGQLATLQASIKNGDAVVENFYDGDIPVDIKPGVGVFVTMNPNYSGRRELPANLKSLFRPCSMSKPDSQVISEVLLLSQGFQAPDLSRKLDAFFQHLQSCLPERPHYDFGLRALKSSILAAGTLLRSSGLKRPSSDDASYEENILVQALHEVVKPKLHSLDVSQYDYALKVTLTKATCFAPALPTDIESVIGTVCDARRLFCDPDFVEKVRQLYALLLHQNAVMLVGPSGSGKTVVWKVLYESLKILSNGGDESHVGIRARQQRASLSVLDPKLLTSKQLYGELDSISREWSDGLFTKLLRTGAELSLNTLTDPLFPLDWIVFDGDVDPDWVETLNSVLDDNKLLTLPNGEQIPLSKNTRILFEASNLQHANLSTVSRCGMVCFGTGSSTLRSLQSSLRSVMIDMCPEVAVPEKLPQIAAVITEVAETVTRHQNMVLDVPLQSLLDSSMTLLRHTLWKLTHQPPSSPDETSETLQSAGASGSVSAQVFFRVLLSTMIKSVSAGLSAPERHIVSTKVCGRMREFQEVRDSMEGLVEPVDLSRVEISADGSFMDHETNINASQQSLSDQIASPDTVIPTPTTTRLVALLQDYLSLYGPVPENIAPLLLCGPPGCGKSMILTSALRDIPNVSFASMSFSSQTSPESILSTLRGYMQMTKRTNGMIALVPKSTGCRVILFCDEVNLERPDIYGTQKSIAFLRCLAERNGFWYGNPAVWVTVRGLQIVAACNPEQDSGRQRISPRFLKCCAVVRVEQPNTEDLHIIYGVFVRSLLDGLGFGLATLHSAALTSAMVDFFNINQERFCPPTGPPTQPHYIYSPRDLSRWVRGMKLLLSSGDSGSERGVDKHDSDGVVWNAVIAAFCYEAKRIFCDRLLKATERKLIELALARIVRDILKSNYDCGVNSLYTSWLAADRHHANQSAPFMMVRDTQVFRTMIYQELRVFAEEEGLGGSWMGGADASSHEGITAVIDQFAVTDDVLMHLTRLERILRQPLGHCVLMGAPGTGKKTLARFAAWMSGMEVHQVRSTSTYTEDDFASDLRSILRKAGVLGRQVMMIFDESNALDSAFLEMMNSVLACGEVPGLFAGDDRVRLLEDMKLPGPKGGARTNTEQGLYNEFVSRIRTNLHIVFTISTGCTGKATVSSEAVNLHDSYDISERSPALYNRCTVNLIDDWTRETLEAVAELKIEVSLGEEQNQIIRSAVEMHERAKLHYSRTNVPLVITPRHYLEFIEQLNRIALEKGKGIQAGVDRHRQGLSRLRNAGNAVDHLKEALSEKSDSLQQKEVRASETLERMIEEQQQAEKAKVAAEQLAFAAQEASERVLEREEEVAAQLAAVQPELDAASEAVGSIRKEYLDELRAMPNPPSGVRIALEGVLMILDGSARTGDLKYTWGNIRNRMRGAEFIASVRDFDPKLLPHGIRSRVEKQTLRNPDFDVGRISYASRAAGPLAEWALAVLAYAEVNDDVRPLQAEVKRLQEEQDELLDRQECAVGEVDELTERIKVCKSEYALLVSEAERVRQEIEDSEASLKKAEDMLDSLAQEWDRWVHELNSFNAAAVTVWGNSVCAAAFIAYCGALDHLSRSLLTRDWRLVLQKEQISFDENLKMSEFLTSPEEKGWWSTQGLETDETSLENYAILKRSARFPLIVDPTRGAAGLLMKILSKSHSREQGSIERRDTGVSTDMRISKTSFAAIGKKSYMRSIESAMRFGTSVLVEDANKFDKAVAPLLGQETSFGTSEGIEAEGPSANGGNGPRIKQRGSSVSQRVVRLGDRDVYLSPQFRLYMSAARIREVPRPAVTRSNVVSFELSPAALQSNCETRAMQLALPSLEGKRKACLAAKIEYENRKHDLEDDVLSAITNVEDIGAELIEGSLLTSLTKLKREVESLEARRRAELESSLEIERVRSLFVPLGHTAVLVFSVLESLAALNQIYVFNTSFFLSLYDSAIVCHGNRPIPQIADTVTECQNSLLTCAFRTVAASLFPKDRLVFACALAFVSVFQGSSSIEGEGEIANLKAVYSALQISSQEGNIPSNKEALRDVLRLLPERFQSMIAGSLSPEPASPSPLEASIHLVRDRLSAPHRVLTSLDGLACTLARRDNVVHGQETRPDVSLRKILRTYSELTQAEVIGNKGLQPPVLLCARGENIDPANLVTETAKQLNISVASIAMGSKQTEDIVSESISTAIQAVKNGRKVLMLFKNMHLASRSAMERLQTEVMRRNGLLSCLIVVVAEVSVHFSGSAIIGATPFFRILAFESPSSFRANFVSAIDSISALRKHNRSDWQCLHVSEDQLQLLLCWLHASLLERTLHAPVGFARHYEFPISDLIAAWDVALCRMRASANWKESLESIAEMLCASTYGCRIEDDTDLDILRLMIGNTVNSRVLEESVAEQKFSFGDSRSSIAIPLQASRWPQFLQLMPLEAPPSWSKMPENTNDRRLSAEGRSSLQRLLTISKKLFENGNSCVTRLGQAEYKLLDPPVSLQELEELAFVEGPTQSAHAELSPLYAWLKTECAIFRDLVDLVLTDLDWASESTALEFSHRLRLNAQKNSTKSPITLSSSPIPSSWYKACTAFGSTISVAHFVTKLCETGAEMRRLQKDNEYNANLSSLLRPNAFLRALTSAEAISRQVPLHELEVIVTDQRGSEIQCRRLHGVHINGVKWHERKGLFVKGEGVCTDPIVAWSFLAKDPEVQYISLPLYGFEGHTSALAMVKIPVGTDSPLEEWRLSGACLSIGRKDVCE